jgi:hypothetical protein
MQVIGDAVLDIVLYHSLLGLASRNKFLSHLPELETIRSSGWPLRNAPNDIPKPLGVYEDSTHLLSLAKSR